MDFTIAQEIISTIQHLFREKQSFVITTHHNSDGDAMGSATAMAEVLRQMGKTVNIVLPNDFPAFFRWMNGTREIVTYDRASKTAQEIIDATDVIICLDFNQLGRIDSLEDVVKNSPKPRIVVDHHLGLNIDAAAVVSFPDASSTCELVYHLLQACGYESYINRDVAESLYTGIVTDTGRLDYASSYAEVYSVVGALVEKGIRKTFIHDHIYNVFTYDRMRLQAEILNENLCLLPEFHTAYMTITLKNQKKHNFQLGDSEGFVNIPMAINDVKFSALFTEYENGTVKVSLRSKGKFPANKFAEEYFSGGGHFNAAGGKFSGTLSDALKLFEKGLTVYKDLLSK